MEMSSTKYPSMFGTCRLARRRWRPTTRLKWCRKVKEKSPRESCAVVSQMCPAPPKREEELAERVKMWQDEMGRLEAQGDEFKLAPVFKINALRMLVAGKAKE